MSPEAMGVAVRKSLDTGGSAQRMGIRTAGDHQPTAAELAESKAYGLLSDGKLLDSSSLTPCRALPNGVSG